MSPPIRSALGAGFLPLPSLPRHSGKPLLQTGSVCPTDAVAWPGFPRGQECPKPLVTPAPMPRGWSSTASPRRPGHDRPGPTSHSFHTYQPLPASPFHYPRCHLTSSLGFCARENWGSRTQPEGGGEGAEQEGLALGGEGVTGVGSWVGGRHRRPKICEDHRAIFWGLLQLHERDKEF